MPPEKSFDLSPKKRELLARLLAEKGLNVQETAAAISPRPVDVPPPLSFSQERLWYLEKLMPGNSAYNIPVAIRLVGLLNAAALHSSLNQVVQRHEVLRAAFDLESIQPRQAIRDKLTIPLPVEALPPDQDLEAALTAEAQRPFNLETGPLLRAKLLKLDPESHIFLFTIHHIIADGWSLAVFFRELSAYYAALAEGRTADLPRPVQYPDFAYWQRQRLSGSLLESQMAYWRQQLGGDLPELLLPLDNGRPQTPSFHGRWLSRTLPATQVAALRALAQTEGTTLFVVLLAAFKTLLHRYSGQREIVIGSPVTNRIQHELENVIGHFINTLVLRTDLSGPITFRDLVQRQKEVVLDGYSNQDIPFEYLLEALQPGRDPRKNPLFQVAFNLQDVPAQAHWRTALDLPGIKAEQLFTHSQTAKLDLTLEVEEQAGELTLSFEYNSDIFSAETIERMAGHFQMLLQGLAADPDRLLTLYPLMTAGEWLYLARWNDTETDFSEHRPLQAIFEALAAEKPEALALVQGQRRLTYGELNSRANQLAHRLRRLGVGPDVPVGICSRRSFAFVSSILAIIKAGGAYVPIDVNYPQERIRYMLANAKAPVLLLGSDQVGKVTHVNGTIIVLDEDDSAGLSSESVENPPLLTRSDNLACILYTSGSTGRPKGVAIPQFAVNRLVLTINYMTLESDDVFAHASSTAFDAATFEIWGALLNGLPLAVIPRETALVPDDLADFLIENKVSVLFLTTSLFNQVAYNRPDVFSRLNAAMFGGEAADPQAVRLVQTEHTPRQLINCYGPTENTTFAACYTIQDALDGVSTVPIGYPITNTTLYVLDKHLNPVPSGILGELYIGGKGLARAYYGMPAMTAAVFVPDPFSKEPGARLYKSGDVVCLRPDSNNVNQLVSHYLGRIDNQIKLRGFRIELSEIESVLDQFPAVQESVVLMREDTPGSKRLVAYLVPQPEQVLSQLELRHFLQNRLPVYMIPATFIILDALPLTANGKVDWRSLPEPGLERPMLETHFAPPQSETEQTVAAIWRNVLKLEQVGRYDNFFDLGGNSLLLVKVHHQLQQTFRPKLTIVKLFTYTTIADVAQYIDQLRNDETPPDSPEIAASMERGQRRRARSRRR